LDIHRFFLPRANAMCCETGRKAVIEELAQKRDFTD
jgi:hypothetical protein